MTVAPGYVRQLADLAYGPADIGPFHRFMMPALLRMHGVDPRARVMDVGAGQGHTSIPLHEAGWRDITVVDREPDAFPLFAQRYGFATCLADLEVDRLSRDDGSVDAILCFHVIEHLREPANLVGELHRVLARGGVLFLVTPDWRRSYRTFYADPTHVRPYDRTSIRRLLLLHGFEVTVHGWNARYGLGRLRAYRLWPRLGMIGTELLAVARKPTA